MDRSVALALLLLTLSARAEAAPGDVILTRPTAVCPGTRLGDEELQATYDDLWKSYNEAVGRQTRAVEATLGELSEEAQKAGNLDLLLFWDGLKKQFTDSGRLQWEPSIQRKGWKKFGNAPFPNTLSSELKKCAEAYADARKTLEEGYAKLVGELTKKGKQDAALALRKESEAVWTGKSPSSPPQEPQPTGAALAIESGLGWLSRHQMPDGSWSFNHARCPGCNGQCGHSSEQASAQDPAAPTALALLAFYGSESSRRNGKYREQLRKGVDFLAKRSLEGNGQCYGPGANLYSQGIAGWALATCYGHTKDNGLKKPAQLALDYIQSAQDPQGGGWRYAPRQPGDTSATGWQILALVAGRKAGLRVRNDVLPNAQRFLDAVQAEGGSRYGYVSPGTGAATSAIGLHCRTEIGGFGWTPKHQAVQRGLQQLLAAMPSDDLYFDLHATKAMQQAGGEQRRIWNEAMRTRLVGTQAQQGHQAGSWREGFDKGHATQVGGRLLCTTFAVLILELCDEQPDDERGHAGS